MTFTLADDAALLQPITIGSHTARNRIFMAPLTRSRAHDDGTRVTCRWSTTRSGRRPG